MQPFIFLLLYLAVLFAANFSLKRFVFSRLMEELTEQGNLAVAICWAAYLLSVSIIYLSALFGPGQGIISDMLTAGGYSIFGIAALILSAKINDQFILHHFATEKSLLEDQNTGTAFVLAGAGIASALVIGACIVGRGGIFSTLVFVVLAQAALVASSRVYVHFIFPELHDNIERNDSASGLVFGGTLVAFGLILAASVRGGFSDWWSDLTGFFISALVGLVGFPLLKAIFYSALLRGIHNRVKGQSMAKLSAATVELAIILSLAIVLSYLI